MDGPVEDAFWTLLGCGEVGGYSTGLMTHDCCNHGPRFLMWSQFLRSQVPVI